MRTVPATILLSIALLQTSAFGSDVQLRSLLEASDMRTESLHPAPDGGSVIAVVRTGNAPYRDDFVGLGVRVLFLIDLRAGSIRPLTAASEDAHSPAWSPDGTRVAFFNRAFHLSTLDLATGNRLVITSVEGAARNPVGEAAEIAWSTDGRSVAFAVQPDVSWQERFIDRTVSAPGSMKGPIVVDGTSDDAPLLRAQGMRGPLFTGTEKVLRTASGVLASLAATERLLSFSGEEAIVRNGSAIEMVPSRRRLGTIEGNVVHAHRTSGGAWLFVSREGEEWLLTSLREESLEILGRTPARNDVRVIGITTNALIAIEKTGTTDRLVEIHLRTGEARTILEDAVVHRVTVVGDRVLAATATATEPESLQLLGAREHVRIGSWPGVNPKIFDGITTRVVRWTSGEAIIEGLYVTPQEEKPRATLLFLHGGPESRATADAHFLHGPLGGYAGLLARAGYAVLLPNFRHGKELGNGRLFQTPAADALAGVEKLVSDGIADPNRLGIYGFSYGAMLTGWIVARDHRFRAAVLSAGTLDMLADDRARLHGDRAYHAYAPGRAGPKDHLLDHWIAPEKYRELSPLERASDVRTPVLLISTAAEHLSGYDYPAYFNALRLNKVAVQWAYYPAAWHGGSWSVDDRVDSMQRIREWFDESIQ
ncbi:MAG: prolyl oligopeptidase family serine peptidase [Acidobacteria bacterium]|nr:prolyl oligopeptidase family serine peptidase [Acidobacteriota bacterium]